MKFPSRIKAARVQLALPLMAFLLVFTACGESILNQDWMKQMNQDRQHLTAEYMELINRAREHQNHLLQQSMNMPNQVNPRGTGHITMLSETQREMTEMLANLNNEFYRIITEEDSKEAMQEKWTGLKEDQKVLIQDFRTRVEQAIRMSEDEMRTRPAIDSAQAGGQVNPDGTPKQ